MAQSEDSQRIVMSDVNDFELIRGAAAIGRALGLTDRRVFWLLEKGILPAQKEGRIWVTTKERLRQFYSGEQAA
jgi:hypothetical protein